MLTSLISWGRSLIFSGLPVREMAWRIKGLDYRAAVLYRARTVPVGGRKPYRHSTH